MLSSSFYDECETEIIPNLLVCINNGYSTNLPIDGLRGNSNNSENFLKNMMKRQMKAM